MNYPRLTVRKLLIAGLLCASFACHADEPPAAADSASIGTLDTIVVSGEQPGPGLWKVSKDDHVLWILGTLRPLPKKMTWVSKDIEATIADSQQVILGPSASISVKGGMLGGLFLLPSLIGARNNPDKEKLVDVVPADLYARWSVLKQKYIGRDRGIEKRRPIFAAQELYGEAIKQSGLSLDDVVGKAVKKAAKRDKVEIIEPRVELRIESAGAAVKEFKKSELDDLECFGKTMSRLETDIEAMKLRANAWALGDINALQAMPYTDQMQACADAVLKASVVEERGLGDLRERLAATWMAAAEKALASNRSTFAVLPLRHLLNADGLLARLRARGYVVEAPE
ncbi:MAG TPA: TraB/GumN family protein [Dokdonella sp.]|uniref:TraB/GumN family protein n=1 Tax=Dokdonella sp. TaxID=2291710 RepID=UPI002D7FC4DB|nr:TraB/GumN family protein [Dokdonella sp.]HET9031898.1 TraB/GumN family protein [Dokdonella sp.]